MNIKNVVAVIAMIAVAIPGIAQSPASLTPNVVDVNPLHSSSVPAKVDRIPIQIRFGGAINADTTLTFVLDLFGFPSSVSLIGNTMSVTTLQWSSGSLDTALYIRHVNMPNPLAGDQVIHLKVMDGDPASNVVQIRFTDRGLFNPNKPFWIELGSNFELLDKIKSNNLYGGVFFHQKDVAELKMFKKKKTWHISIFAGVYESKTASSEVSFDTAFLYRDGASYIQQTKGYLIHRDTGVVKVLSTVNNLGLFFSPHVRLSRMSANSDGVRVFISFWGEMIWQTQKTRFDFSQTGRIDSGVFVQNIKDVNQYLSKNASTTMDYRTHYWGVGMPLIYRYQNFNLFVHAVAGLSTQRFIPIQDGNKEDGSFNTFVVPKHSSTPFYIIQFRLNEDEYGIAFTGEIRGFMYHDSKPLISLALSKKFDLSKLLEFAH